MFCHREITTEKCCAFPGWCPARS